MNGDVFAWYAINMNMNNMYLTTSNKQIARIASSLHKPANSSCGVEGGEVSKNSKNKVSIGEFIITGP